MNYYILNLEIDGSTRICLSLLPQNAITPATDKDKIVVGFLQKAQADPGHFTEHMPFKRWLHGLIEEHLPKQAPFQEEGKKVKDGYVYAIDKRTKKLKGDIPLQDIIGAFNFENGQIVPGSYLPNQNYKLFTVEGLFQLPFSLESILAEQINAAK